MNLSMFVQDFARLLKKKTKGIKGKEIQGMNLNTRKLFLIFELEKP